jgi:hypothetical protein
MKPIPIDWQGVLFFKSSGVWESSPSMAITTMVAVLYSYGEKANKGEGGRQRHEGEEARQQM